MSLRVTAAADAQKFLNDSSRGFGWSIVLTAPSGAVANLKGFSNDIGLTIDDDTGQTISGRTASAALSLGDIIAALPGDGIPEGIMDASISPWVAEFEDITGANHVFKVTQSNPDRALGLITLLLERYVKPVVGAETRGLSTGEIRVLVSGETRVLV